MQLPTREVQVCLKGCNLAALVNLGDCKACSKELGRKDLAAAIKTTNFLEDCKVFLKMLPVVDRLVMLTISKTTNSKLLQVKDRAVLLHLAN